MLKVIGPVVVAMAVAAGVAGAQTKDRPLVVGKDAPEPKRVKYVAPEYPADAKAKEVKGIVVLALLISEKGKVDEVRVVRPLSLVTEAAVAAARQWEYEATLSEGKAAWVSMVVTVAFPPG